MRVYFSDDIGGDALSPDLHRFRDTGDYFIAGNNDTGDNLLLVTMTPAIICCW